MANKKIFMETWLYIFVDPDTSFAAVTVTETPPTLYNTQHLLLTLAALLSTQSCHTLDMTFSAAFECSSWGSTDTYISMCGGVCVHYVAVSIITCWCHLQLTASPPLWSLPLWLLFVCNTGLSINNGIILLPCTQHTAHTRREKHRV